VPVYQYACTECGEQLEVRQSFTEDALTVCPVCEGRLRKVLSAVGVVFKGSGFYRTDSRVPAGATASGTPSESSSDASSNGSSNGSSKTSDSPGSSSTGASGASESSSNGSATKSSKPATPAATG
jgi:putative FmdB family regulatory protein